MIYRLSVCLLLAFVCGCRCPGPRPDAVRSGEPPAGAPAAIQQSFSYVEGIVDSVLRADAAEVQLQVTIISARPGSTGVSMVEQGAKLTVAVRPPQDGRSSEFFLHPRQGAAFSGSLIRAQDGRWILQDAATR